MSDKVAEFETKVTGHCPICHQPREVHDCTTRTASEVDDNWCESGRRSSVSLFVWCHHPETYRMLERARRYHEIESRREESDE